MATKETKTEEVKEEADAPETPILHGVLVTKKVAENGTISTEVQPLGEVQPTEVQTLLELGVKSWRGQIGLA